MRKLLIAIFALGVLTLASAQTIGLSISTLNNPFFVTLRDGAQAAADAAGVTLIVLDAQDDVNKQISDFEDLIQRGVDVIIVNPTDSDAIVVSVLAANQAGVPVIAVDRGANGGELAAFIASDNVAGGALAAEFINEQLGGSGNVVELEGIPGTSAARDRGAGFNQYLASEAPGLTVVARQTANFNRAEGLSVAENILQAQPDVQAIFAHNDEMALGALQAVRGSGRDILIVGFDATDEAVAAVEAGDLAATVAQQPFELGRVSVEHALLIFSEGAPAETLEIAVPLQLVTQ